MKKNLIFLIIGIFIITPNYVYAHPGRTDSKGCHYCRKNCEDWGLNYNEYHCHNGNNNSNSNNNTNKITTTPKTKTKNNDNTLKQITINNEDIEIQSYMTYITKKKMWKY